MEILVDEHSDFIVFSYAIKRSEVDATGVGFITAKVKRHMSNTINEWHTPSVGPAVSRKLRKERRSA